MLKTEAAVYSHLHFSPVRPPLTSSRLSPTTAATTSTLLRDGVICGDGCRRRNMTPKNRINTPGTSHPMAVSAIAASTRRESEPVRVRDLAAAPPMPVSCSKGSLDVFFSYGKTSHATRVMNHVSMRMVCTCVLPPVRRTHLLSPNVITRELYLESRQVDLGDREAVERNDDGGI